MRVLWISNTSSNYKLSNSLYNGGGWVSSAEKVISSCDDVDLAVAFSMDGEPFKTIIGSVAYYPISDKRSKWLKLKSSLLIDPYRTDKYSCEVYINEIRKVIVDFKPDIIHVWGSEEYWGVVSEITAVPVVLHIQGLIIPYLNAYLPPSVGWHEYKKCALSFSISGLRRYVTASREKLKWKVRAVREQNIFKNVNCFMGRTNWDKRVSHVLNPQSRYFHCDEFLRDCFYEPAQRNIPEKLTIVTTISSPLYKGVDLLLKTAKLLKDNLNVDFEWNCFGNVDVDFVEKITGIKSTQVNVFFNGVATADQLKQAELNSTCYVHTSYIDNSPNSLCEAQMLGVTCLSTNVGGIPSLIDNEKTGFLFPANDPYQAAYLIENIYKNKDLNIKIGSQAQDVAIKRHDRQTIVESLLSVYRTLTKK